MANESAETIYSPTARVFRLLSWLSRQPLSVNAINTSFIEGGSIEKPVSDDTIWLYINTLRKLGCQIIRPKPTNNFQYTLLSHPYGLHIEQQDIDLCIRLRDLAEPHWPYMDMLALDTCLANLFSQCRIDGKPSNTQTWYTLSRSIDYQDQLSLIQQLTQHVQERQVLKLNYSSPHQGERLIYLFGIQLTYRRGALYLNGYQVNHTEISLLRVERIQQVDVVKPDDASPAIRQLVHTLYTQTQDIPQFVIRLYEADTLPLDFPCSVASTMPFQDDHGWGVEIIGQSRDFFTLRHWLLASGHCFCIQEPSSFRIIVLEILQRAHNRYFASSMYHLPTDN